MLLRRNWVHRIRTHPSLGDWSQLPAAHGRLAFASITALRSRDDRGKDGLWLRRAGAAGQGEQQKGVSAEGLALDRMPGPNSPSTQLDESKPIDREDLMGQSAVRRQRQNWTHDQLKLAFHLYCQLPFGKLHKTNPEIVELAKLIGRTPSALAMKLVNFASLDPVITDSGRKGLSGASAADRAIWSEFHSDWESLALECADLKEELRQRWQMPAPEAEDDGQLEIPTNFEGQTRIGLREYRIKQGFFRRAVLSSYDNRCCMSGLAEKRLLVASHIVPWSVDKANRLNPANGLSLSAIHDRAFDKGLITVLPDLTIRVSPALSEHKANELVTALLALDGRAIVLPKRFRPSETFLEFHSRQVFVAG